MPIYSSDGGPPPGWTVLDGVLAPQQSIGGFAARHQTVRAICRQKDCRRNCAIDFERWVEKGYERVSFRELQRMLRCNRPDGCALEFEGEVSPLTLQLNQISGQANVRIRFACTAGQCNHVRTATPEAVIARLLAEKRGDPSTPVCDLRGLLKGPCPTCGKSNWKVDVLWANTASNGWRAGLRPW
jgi:hypothetical protein